MTFPFGLDVASLKSLGFTCAGSMNIDTQVFWYGDALRLWVREKALTIHGFDPKTIASLGLDSIDRVALKPTAFYVEWEMSFSSTAPAPVVMSTLRRLVEYTNVVNS